MNLQYALDTFVHEIACLRAAHRAAVDRKDTISAMAFVVKIQTMEYAIEVLEAALEDSK